MSWEWAGLTYQPGANILLAYFHYCNRGTYPFSDECKESDLQNLAELNGGAIDFVRWTREQAEMNSKFPSLQIGTFGESKVSDASK